MAIYYSPSNRGFYDDRLTYSSLPEDTIEITKEEHLSLLFEINSNNKMIVVSDGAISLQEKTPTPITWDVIRDTRNFLLKESDYTQLPDFTLVTKTVWTTYRQTLRDIPQTYATPDEVIWPTPPT
jgi:hypothetical protein